MGTGSGDVDDGFALAAVLSAAARGECVLAGVSVVSGNTTADKARVAARAMLDAAGPPFDRVKVLGPKEAPFAIAELEADAKVLAIGPPTNVVRACSLDPDLAGRLQVWAVARVLDPVRHPILPFFCLNFSKHPQDAARFDRLLFQRCVMCPLDVVQRLRVGADSIARIRERGRMGAYLWEHSRRWLRIAPVRYASARFPVWDLVAALHLLGKLPQARVQQEGAAEVLFDFSPKAALAGFEHDLVF